MLSNHTRNKDTKTMTGRTPLLSRKQIVFVVFMLAASSLSGVFLSLSDSTLYYYYNGDNNDRSLNNNLLTAKIDLVHPKPKNYAPPQLVWLLSFPNRYVGWFTTKAISTFGPSNSNSTFFTTCSKQHSVEPPLLNSW